MAVMRVEKTGNYTVMSNRHLDDPRLSLKAIGLLSKILRLPDDWDYTLEGLARICKEGKDAIRSAIVELEQAGYIERRQTHAADGSFAGNEYIVHEEPLGADAPPSSENPTTVSPSSGNPSTDNPSTGNPTQPNTISTKYLDTNTPLTPPEGAASAEKRTRSRAGVEAGTLRGVLEVLPARRVQADSDRGLGQAPAGRCADRRHRPRTQAPDGQRGVAAGRRHPICVDIPQPATLGGRKA